MVEEGVVFGNLFLASEVSPIKYIDKCCSQSLCVSGLYDRTYTCHEQSNLVDSYSQAPQILYTVKGFVLMSLGL